MKNSKGRKKLINYLVDASVYALPEAIPQYPNEKQKNIYNEYLHNLNLFFKQVFPKETSEAYKEFLKVNRFLFSHEDFKILINEKLILDITNKHKLESLVTGNSHRLIHGLFHFLMVLIKKKIEFIPDERYMNLNNDNSPKPGKFRSIEEYLGIKNVNVDFNEDNDRKKCLSKILLKNLSILSFLNQYVYKTQDVIGIITTNHEQESNLNINQLNLEHKFNKNIIQENVIGLNGNIIRKYYLNEIEQNNFESLIQLKESIEEDNSLMETLEFGEEVDIYINEYENILANYLEANDEGIKKDVECYKNEYLNIVYECICGLDKLVNFYNNRNEQDNGPISELFTCSDTIRKYDNQTTCNKCRGFLRICGFGCNGEITERFFGNERYNIHLKPYSWGEKEKNKHLFDLTLRIYFKWNEDNNKIKIGYIGQHQDLPPQNH
jgi:hypothetical protein